MGGGAPGGSVGWGGPGGAIWGVGGAACRSTKCSTHARPGMHMQQCSAVLHILHPFSGKDTMYILSYRQLVIIMLGGGGGAQAPLTSPCPPSNHSVTINLTLTFAASWFGHASHVDWAEQDPSNFVHGCFCHIIALHFGPQHSL